MASHLLLPRVTMPRWLAVVALMVAWNAVASDPAPQGRGKRSALASALLNLDADGLDQLSAKDEKIDQSIAKLRQGREAEPVAVRRESRSGAEFREGLSIGDPLGSGQPAEVRLEKEGPEEAYLGRLSPKRVARVVAAHQGEVTACVEAHVESRRSGEVKIQYVIDPSGDVSRVRVKRSTVASEALERCLVDAVSTWQFPEPTGGSVLVTTPWKFKAGRPKKAAGRR